MGLASWPTHVRVATWRDCSLYSCTAVQLIQSLLFGRAARNVTTILSKTARCDEATTHRHDFRWICEATPTLVTLRKQRRRVLPAYRKAEFLWRLHALQVTGTPRRAFVWRLPYCLVSSTMCPSRKVYPSRRLLFGTLSSGESDAQGCSVLW